MKEKPLSSPQKALRSLGGTPPTSQSKRQTFDCVLLPSPRKSGISPRSQTTSPVPNATGSQVATLQRTLRPVPRLLSNDEIIEDENGDQSPSKRAKKQMKRKLSGSQSDWENEHDIQPQILPTRRSTRSSTTKKGKEAPRVVNQGRGWVVIEEDVTPDEEPARSSIAQRASARTSRSQARRSPDAYTPAKVKSKRQSPVKKKQTKKTLRRVKPTSPTPSSPSNTFDSTDQSEATTDVGSESEIDLGAETDTTSYSLKFHDPLVAQSPRSTVSSLAIPVPSDFETDMEEPDEYTPAIRQSSVGTPIMVDVAEDDPEMELDEPDVRPVTSQSRVLRGPLPHHLYPFVPLQKVAVLQRLRNPPYVELGGDKATNKAGKELRGLLEGTMERGEGNSCLILGPRGSGKSLVGTSLFLTHSMVAYSPRSWSKPHSENSRKSQLSFDSPGMPRQPIGMPCVKLHTS